MSRAMEIVSAKISMIFTRPRQPGFAGKIQL